MSYDGQHHVGTIEATAAGIVAVDIDGRRIGVFATSIEAVSELHRAWRLPTPIDVPSRSTYELGRRQFKWCLPEQLGEIVQARKVARAKTAVRAAPSK